MKIAPFEATLDGEIDLPCLFLLNNVPLLAHYLSFWRGEKSEEVV